MTLKEKFENVEIMFESQIGTLKYDELDRASNHCEKIADEFAIGFAEWIHSNTGYAGNGHYAVIGHTSYHTIPKLLEIYKQEQGL
jgi:hypothetical protein